jgi:tetratricopeptide (TPR) repeat protein
MTNPQKSDRAKFWFIAGSVCLFLLALLWSVDGSFLYLGLGMAVFCFFQYARHAFQNSAPPRYSRPAGQTESESSKAVEDLLQEIQMGFTKKKKSVSGKSVLGAIIGASMFLFVVIFLVALSLEWDSDYFTYLDQASYHYSTGNYDSAAYYYRLASLKDPDNPDIYYERGNAFMYMERYDSAIALFDKTLAISPGYGPAQFNKGYVMFQQGKYRQCIAETRKVLSQNPDDFQARLLIGDSYYNQQQVDSALHWYSRTYEDGYRSAALSHMMAYIYDTRGETSKAIPLYKEALEYDNSISEIYDRLAELLPPEEGNFYRTKASGLEQENADW